MSIYVLQYKAPRIVQNIIIIKILLLYFTCCLRVDHACRQRVILAIIFNIQNNSEIKLENDFQV